MPLEVANKVDAIGIDVESGEVVLTIADSWDWRDEPTHLHALQMKFNSYLDFIETGQLLESYPSAEGRNVTICIVFRMAPTESAQQFLATAIKVAAENGCRLIWQQFGGGGLPTRNVNRGESFVSRFFHCLAVWTTRRE
jgi:hypothetical protein